MPLVSKGLVLGHGLSANVRAAPSQIASGARSLHVHVPRAGLPYPPPASSSYQPAANAAGRILQTTRTAFVRFFAHLTTPGLGHPATGAWGRSLSTRASAAVRPPSIQQRLSLPVRNSLAQRPCAPFLPRPSSGSPSTVHVGLGTARNFSTARPIFQHLAQNVPVAGRAFYEADWHVERKKMKNKVKMSLKAKEQKENARYRSLTKPSSGKTSFSTVEELDRYFPVCAPAAPGVTTVLLVPLAPTPTSRVPLSDAPRTLEPHLLPLSDLQDIVSSHRVHSLRVSSLFARLDARRVWEKGASFTAHGDASGLCTILRVEFCGWTEASVREVLGEAGLGWCRIVEFKEYGEESESESGMSSFISSRSLSPDIDPAASVVLPTLDFSASFLAVSNMSRPPSPLISFPSSPALSDLDMGFSPLDSMFEDMGSDGGRAMGFSSEFVARAAGDSYADY
ncbi:hypothetical protein M0805_005505 [Coniferiporia weirii]|nr:hypothetical protein M0805_005505 [Coniferiporia weirii]